MKKVIATLSSALWLAGMSVCTGYFFGLGQNLSKGLMDDNRYIRGYADGLQKAADMLQESIENGSSGTGTVVDIRKSGVNNER